MRFSALILCLAPAIGTASAAVADVHYDAIDALECDASMDYAATERESMSADAIRGFQIKVEDSVDSTYQHTIHGTELYANRTTGPDP